jgi:hypothetical protein
MYTTSVDADCTGCACAAAACAPPPEQLIPRLLTTGFRCSGGASGPRAPCRGPCVRRGRPGGGSRGCSLRGGDGRGPIAALRWSPWSGRCPRVRFGKCLLPRDLHARLACWWAACSSAVWRTPWAAAAAAPRSARPRRPRRPRAVAAAPVGALRGARPPVAERRAKQAPGSPAWAGLADHRESAAAAPRESVAVAPRGRAGARSVSPRHRPLSTCPRGPCARVGRSRISLPASRGLRSRSAFPRRSSRVGRSVVAPASVFTSTTGDA